LYGQEVLGRRSQFNVIFSANYLKYTEHKEIREIWVK
jgi:hypothetical protein